MPAAVPSDVLAPSSVSEDGVLLSHADPDHLLDGVRLWVDQEIDVPREFRSVPGGWELALPIPSVGRLEYLFELVDGVETALTVDAGNPLRVDGAFGEHSWLPMPGYREPGWLDEPAWPGNYSELTVITDLAPMELRVWSPEGAGTDPLPLLISHDGPEMDQYGALTRFVGAGIRAGALPAMRVALLQPGDRDLWYGADPDYADALVGRILPALAEHVPVAGRPLIMGQSLGGLAALHAAWRHPDAFAAVFSQSGSFFTPETDPQESGFGSWDAIVAFTTELHGAETVDLPPVVLVCGSAEENLANNLLVASDLTRAGADVGWADIADGHTWTCWRDLLDPHLGDLIRRSWPA